MKNSKKQFIEDMKTNDVKKLTVGGGCMDSIKRLMSLCNSEEEIHHCKTALLRYVKDYKDERFSH